MAKNQYINRELSWLKFNERVLQEAADRSVPPIDRLRFVGIFSNNLDEFFKVRYATVKRVAQTEGKDYKLLDVNAKKLLEQITKEVIYLQNKSLKILETIRKELEKEGIYIIQEDKIREEHIPYVKDYFIKKVSPALFVILLDEVKDFPKLKDDSAYLAIKMTFKEKQKNNLNSETSKNRYALIELPSSIDRFVVLPEIEGRQYIIMLDDLIRYCLGSIFSVFDYESISAYMIKITRDAELDIDDDLSKSFISKISSSVEGRRNGEPVRFVFDKNIDKQTLDFLLQKMGIEEETDSVIPGGRYHNRRDYMRFPMLNHTNLCSEMETPLPIPNLSLEDNLFTKVAQKDYLLFTPYQDFSYVIRFLREAALDPQVRTIKITIYRLAKNSQIVNSLINAVKNGKKVTVQIELQARFDEQSNIDYAEQMQAEGIKLIFGVRGLKVHSKICVIEREENKKLVRYGFISTGNFNESTAKIYTDYTLMTANHDILKEVNKVFNFFETPYKSSKYKHLLVSPYTSKKTFLRLIDKEIKNAKGGKSAYIKLKMNSLTSYKMVDKLYEASRAGVKIQMIVRGICCLIPGVQGMSENIEVISIVDKYLEHPRLYIFGNDDHPIIYMSSADWMTRNLDHRVEVSCPIYDEDIRKELLDTFEIGWKDTVKARVISEKQDNAYRPKSKKPVRSQVATYEYYQKKLLNT